MSDNISIFAALVASTPISNGEAVILSAPWDALNGTERALAVDKARALGRRDAVRQFIDQSRVEPPRALSDGRFSYAENVLFDCEHVLGTYRIHSIIDESISDVDGLCRHAIGDCLIITDTTDPRIVSYRIGWTDGFLMMAPTDERLGEREQTHAEVEREFLSGFKYFN